MNKGILFVDDDSHILASYQRQLRKRFNVDTALGARQGLAQVANRGPYAVVVSDLRMPGMDGIEFLSRVRDMSPDTVRMMLTGCADVENAIQAVNQGNIFRFLTKPCDPPVLIRALNAGLEQYRLIRAERELLGKTLRGSVRVLTEVLGLLNPKAYGRAQRITRYVREIALHMELPRLWQLETAAMLSQIGCITLPEEILEKIYQGQSLTKEESRLFKRHPSVASGLLSHIPYMEEICQIIAHQEKDFNGAGVSEEPHTGEDIPLGVTILKTVLDFDTLQASGIRKKQALRVLKQKITRYNRSVLAALEAVIEADNTNYEAKTVTIEELRENMILADDVLTLKSVLLVPKGTEVSQPILERLKNFACNSKVREPIQVFAPVIEKQPGEFSNLTQ